MHDLIETRVDDGTKVSVIKRFDSAAGAYVTCTAIVTITKVFESQADVKEHSPLAGVNIGFGVEVSTVTPAMYEPLKVFGAYEKLPLDRLDCTLISHETTVTIIENDVTETKMERRTITTTNMVAVDQGNIRN